MIQVSVSDRRPIPTPRTGPFDNTPARFAPVRSRPRTAAEPTATTFGRASARPAPNRRFARRAFVPFRPFFEGRVMDFRPLAELERRSVITALRGNADRGVALLMDPKDTRFVGTAEEVPDDQVIAAVKSVPCHY
jgi:hypothetical protein